MNSIIKRIAFLALSVITISMLECTDNTITNELPDAFNNDSITQKVTTSTNRYFDYLAEMGFDRNNMIETDGNLIVVEGDIAINKYDLPGTGALGKTAQKFRSPLISTANAGNIRLMLHSSIRSWSGIISRAVADWNSVPNCLIKIQIVTSNPELTIWSDATPQAPDGFYNLPPNVCARAMIPGDDNVGTTISINCDHVDINTDLKRQCVITHEIGHTLGLMHTNENMWRQIESTPVSDETSIMFSYFDGIARKISFFDRIALLSLYPAIEPDNIVWRNTNGQVHYWNILNGQNVGGYDIGSPVESEWALRGVGDVNGNGSDDIIWQHNNGQVLYWDILYGEIIGRYNIGSPVEHEWTLCGVGDITGDGTHDLIWQHTNGQLYYWNMQNGQSIGGYNIGSPVPYEWTFRGVGDLNGDGTGDIIWQNSNGIVHYWAMANGKNMGDFNVYNVPVGSEWSLVGAGNVN